MRCFVACFPSPGSAERLQIAVQSFLDLPAGVRWVPVANYHLTLRFLGEIAMHEAPTILGAVADLGGAPLTCRIRDFGGFPRPEHAYVVVAGIEPREEFARWSADLSLLAGSESNKEFVPHITVARGRRRVTVTQIENLEGLKLDLAAPALYESVSVPGGVRYRMVTVGSGSGG